MTTRPAEATRNDLVDAAVEVFAARGFEAGSVREIARRAGANLAAVSYHFGGKEGLYREVLARSLDAFDMPSFDAAAVAALDREAALKLFLREQVATMRKHSEIARYLRIFAWEDFSRTPVFADFLATRRLPLVEIGLALVERWLPHTTPERKACALVWLLHQAEPFFRNPERLAGPPLRLRVDGGFVERLSDMLATTAIAGLDALERDAA